jgi:hypothetical protein
MQVRLLTGGLKTLCGADRQFMTRESARLGVADDRPELQTATGLSTARDPRYALTWQQNLTARANSTNTPNLLIAPSKGIVGKYGATAGS